MKIVIISLVVILSSYIKCQEQLLTQSVELFFGTEGTNLSGTIIFP